MGLDHLGLGQDERDARAAGEEAGGATTSSSSSGGGGRNSRSGGGSGSSSSSSSSSSSRSSRLQNERLARQYRQVMVVMPSDQLPPGLEGTPMHTHFAGMGDDAEPDLRIVRLEEFERNLWTTLQADLLFVIGTLLSNKARDKTQAVLIEVS